MRNLVLLTIFLVLCGTSCEEEPIPGYSSEPYFVFEFANPQIPFKLFSKSKNKAKMEEVKNSRFPGIDMNSNETQYFLMRNQKTDSFTLKYKLKTFMERDNIYIKFQTVELSQTSILNSKLQVADSNIYDGYIPVLIIPE